ncbi:hypothetical protein CYMTET_21490, partial [Cymbomonas tetramitiformis]
ETGGVISLFSMSYMNIIRISACEVSHNTASKSGGVISISSGGSDNLVTISHCNVVHNRAEASSGRGGVLRLEATNGNNVTMSDSNFSHNFAGGAGGLLGLYGRSNDNSESESSNDNGVVLMSCNVTNNSAGGNGGVVDMYGSLSDYAKYRPALNNSITIRRCNLSYNQAQESGGVISLWGSSDDNEVTLTDNLMVHNIAEKYGGMGFIGYDHGVIIVVKNSNISANVAEVSGGALYISGVQADQGDQSTAFLHISACLMADNKAGADGGAVAAEDIQEGEVAISGSEVRGNMAQNRGGGCKLKAARLRLEGTVLQSNRADEGGAVAATEESACHVSDCVATGNAAFQGGAVLASGGSAVDVTGSQLSLNAADFWGGAAYATQSFLRVANNSALEQNAAWEGGGGVAGVHANVSLEDARLALNEGQRGGLFLARSTVRLARVEVERCSADGGGGGVYAGSGSQGWMRDTSVVGCNTEGLGGAVQADQGSLLALINSNFTSNTADARGGAVSGSDSSNISLDGCRLERNVAQDAGGAVWATEGSSVSLRECAMLENSVGQGDGGGVALASTVSDSVLENCAFEANAAARGGGVFLQLPPPAPKVQLRGNRFGLSDATVGPHIFWEYDVSAARPECDDCSSLAAGDAVLTSTAVSFVVQRMGATVSELTGASGSPIQPALTFVALDLYGNATRLVQQVTAVAGAAQTETLLDGATVAVYGSDGAAFDGLTVLGHPGTLVNLTLQSEADWGLPATATVTMLLDECLSGEQYLEDAKLCRPCKDDTLKFRNTSEACVACVGAGLMCHGGANYSLSAGYWVASRSVELCLQAGEELWEDCLLQRTYACDTADACSPSWNRSNVGGAVTLPAGLDQCSTGYRNDVVMCGGCEAGYERLYDGRCSRCTDVRFTRWLVTVACLGAVAALLSLAWRFGKSKKMARESFLGKRLLAVHSAEDSHANFGILAGHLQVMAQHLQVFQVDVFPGIYEKLLDVVSVINVSPTRWLGLQCALAGSINGPTYTEVIGMSVFYSHITFTLVLPFVIAAPLWVFVLPRLLRWSSRKASTTLRRMASSLSGSFRRPSPRPDGAATSAASSPCRSMRNHAGHPPAVDGLVVEYCSNSGAGSVSARPSTASGKWQIEQVKWIANPFGEDEGGHSSHVPQDGAELGLSCEVDSRNVIEDDQQEGGVLDNPDNPCSACQEGGREQPSDHSKNTCREGGKEEPSEESFKRNGKDLGKEQLPNNSRSVCQDEDEEGVADSADGVRTPAAASPRFKAYCVFASFVLVLIHPSVCSACFTLFDCEQIHFQAEGTDFFLRADRSVECFSLEWRSFAAFASFVMLTFVFGLPIGLIGVTFYLHRRKCVSLAGRHIYVPSSLIKVTLEAEVQGGDPCTDETISDDACSQKIACYQIPHPVTGKLVVVSPVFEDGAITGDGVERIKSQLMDSEAQLLLGRYTAPFSGQYFYWMGIEIMLRLLSTSVVVLVRMVDERYDLVYALCISGLILIIYSVAHPYEDPLAHLVVNLSEGCQVFTLCGYVAERYINEQDSTASAICGIFLVSIHSLFILTMIIMVLNDLRATGSTLYQNVRRSWHRMRRKLCVQL